MQSDEKYRIALHSEPTVSLAGLALAKWCRVLVEEDA